MDVALHYNRVPLDDDALMELVGSASERDELRASSLATLERRGSARLDDAIADALTSDAPAPARDGARDALAALRPDEALASIEALAPDAPALEAQRSYATLARLASDGLAGGGRAGSRATWPRSARASCETTSPSNCSRPPRPAERPRRNRSAPIAPRWATKTRSRRSAWRSKAGDAEAGRAILRERRATACAATPSGGEGGVVGPPLTRIGSLLSREGLLEAMVEPSARIAPGYGQVDVVLDDGSRISGTFVGEDNAALSLAVDSGHGEASTVRVDKAGIAERSDPTSAMPPMGRVLSLRDLRDVVAYLASLR